MSIFAERKFVDLSGLWLSDAPKGVLYGRKPA
jgi:hypothetical protein